MRLAAAVAPLALLFASASVSADEAVWVCFNYGCSAEQEVTFSEEQLSWIHEMLEAATTAERERRWLALAVGQFYAWAGKQSPIWRDRGGNYADDGLPGTMDCIDHSTTTTRLLRVLERRGWLRYHRVLEPVWRKKLLILQHESALIEEVPDGRMQAVKAGESDEQTAVGNTMPQRFVVDSWFVDNGRPAVVLPLENWLKGGGPSV